MFAAHHNILSSREPREDVCLLGLRYNPEGAADVEVLIHRPVVVRDGVHMLRVDEEVISKPRVAQVMHCRCTDQAENLELGELERGLACSEDDHGCLSDISCMCAVVVVVVALVSGLHCHEEALRLLPVDHPAGLLQPSSPKSYRSGPSSFPL